MNDQIRLTVAGMDERPAVLAVTRAAYDEYAGKSDQSFWRMYERSIEQTILSDETVTSIVAKSGTEILGAVLYCPPYEKKMGDRVVKNPYPEMRLLAVPAKNRNRGIAARLIEHCELVAKQSGSKTMTLHTTVLMQTAKQMYEKRGYVKYPEIDFEPVPGFVVWGYRKEL